MKKSLVIAILVLTLLLAACGSQESTPKQIATFCAELPIFMQALEDFHALGADSDPAEYAAAYAQAVATGSVLREAAKGMNEQEIKDFSEAVNKYATALDYVPSTIPAATDYLQMMASVEQQYQEVLKAYVAVEQNVCTP